MQDESFEVHMLFWIYWLLVALLVLGCALEVLRRDSGWREAGTATLVLVPLLLRVLLVK
jgi:hypothetical protein